MSTRDGVLLASAARTVLQTGEWQSSGGYSHLILLLDFTVDAVSADLTLTLQGRDPASGDPFNVWTAAAAASAVAMFAYGLGPGLLTSVKEAMTDVGNVIIPATWRVNVAVGDSNEATYSLGYILSGG